MYIFISVSKFGSTLTDSMWNRKEIKLMLRFRLVQMDRHQTERRMTTIAYRSWLLIKVSNSYTVESLEFVVALFSRILWVPLSNEYTFLINYNTLYISLKMQVNLQKMDPMKYHNFIVHCITLSPNKIWFISKQCMNHFFLFSRHSSTNRYCHIEDKSVGHQ